VHHAHGVGPEWEHDVACAGLPSPPALGVLLQEADEALDGFDAPPLVGDADARVRLERFFERRRSVLVVLREHGATAENLAAVPLPSTQCLACLEHAGDPRAVAVAIELREEIGLVIGELEGSEKPREGYSWMRRPVHRAMPA
jgi:hypothetical protein